MSRLNEMMAAAIAEEGAAGKESATTEGGGGAATEGTTTTPGAEAPAEGEAGAEGAAAAPGVEGEKEQPAEDAAGKPADKAKDPKEDVSARRFAALAKRKEEVLELEGTVRRDRAQVQQQHQAVEAEKQRFATEREAWTKKRESEEREFEGRVAKVFDDPDAFFQFAIDAFDLKSKEDFERYARGALQRSARRRPAPSAAAAPDAKPDEERLTRAEVQELLKKDREHAERTRLADEERRDFIKLTADDTKYEAAALLLSDDERYAKALEIAKRLTSVGESYSAEDLADAVNEFAKGDPRWHRLQKRTAERPVPASPTKSPPPAAATSRAGSPTQTPIGRQNAKATTTLSNEAVAERAGAASSGGPKRKTHQERFAAMLRRESA